jgi:hypothetical protein
MLLASLPTCIRAAVSALVLLFASASPLMAADVSRLFVLTDIGNEPDDQMSLVRLLVYSNEIDIEGIGATTSVWQRDKVQPQLALDIIDAYGKVLPRLREHAAGWRDAEALRRIVYRGVAGYGLAAIDADHPSEAAQALLIAAKRHDQRPLWVALWGGANTLADALRHARTTLPPAEHEALVRKLRVYSISDQDDAGAWIRREFPQLFYVVTPSTQDGADYARATWTGISGDRFYRNGAGADFTTVSNEWLERNIRTKGPLGAHYLRYAFIMEGDTPSFLGLIPNGLQSGDHPNWGGWSGRYLLRQPLGESRPIWTQGGDSFPRVTSADTVNGVTSDQASIWRWRNEFQNDFAARMDWTVTPFAAANHPPQPVVNGISGSKELEIAVSVGKPIALDAGASTDPDRNRLAFRWFQYDEAGYDGGNFGPAPLDIAGANKARATVTATAPCRPNWLAAGECPRIGVAHLILAVTDNGKPALTRYKRVILRVGS